MMPLLGQARSASSGAHGYLVLITTVAASGVVIFSMAELMNSQPPLVLLASSRENLTSADVIGVPSLNVTSVRSLNVQVSLSADWVQLVASQGSTEVPSVLPTVRVSKICTYTQMDALLKTMVLSKSTESRSLAMMMLPPLLPAG